VNDTKRLNVLNIAIEMMGTGFFIGFGQPFIENEALV
jgi:hypothetical protein